MSDNGLNKKVKDLTSQSATYWIKHKDNGVLLRAVVKEILEVKPEVYLKDSNAIGS